MVRMKLNDQDHTRKISDFCFHILELSHQSSLIMVIWMYCSLNCWLQYNHLTMKAMLEDSTHFTIKAALKARSHSTMKAVLQTRLT